MYTQFLKYDLIIASMELCFQTDSSISQDEFSLGWRKPILSCLIASFFSLLLSYCWLLWVLKPEPYFSLLGNSMELPVVTKKSPLSLLSYADLQYISTRPSLRYTFSRIYFLFTWTKCEKLLINRTSASDPGKRKARFHKSLADFYNNICR